jgi:UDP:flavonoid glycosyltransferase YjiC (YdhE family)
MLGRAQAAGFAARELTQAYTLFDRLNFHPQARVFGYLSSPAVGEELLAIAGEDAPDAVVIDGMFSAALDVAPRLGVPSAVMVHTFVRRMFAAWRSNLQMQSDGRVRGGFPPLPPIEELWGARHLLHANTLAAFDDAPEAPPSNLVHGAPVLEQEPRAVPPALPWAEDDPTPIVLLSFSTVLEQRSREKLQRALDALAPLPVHVVATTGGIVEPSELAAPANAAVLRFASHETLMRRASFVVAHGGHGTTMRSLRHALPLVCIPAGAGDQPFVGAAVQEWGAGRALAGDAGLEDIRSAAEAILKDDRYRAAAARCAAQLAGADGAAAAAAALERLIAPAMTAAA